MTPALRESLLQGEKLGLRFALQIPQSALSGLTGTQMGRSSGTSIDFQDYREYQPGDDLRYIDWNVYARTDRLTVKLFREEVTPHLDIVLDGSRSMDLEETRKAHGAAELAGILASAAANAQCTHAVWVSGEGFRRLANDTLSPSTWDGLEFSSVRTVDQSMQILGPKLRRLGVRVFLSDLLWPGDPLQTVRRLSEGAAALFVIQLLARDDAVPPAHGNIRLIDSESGENTEVYIDALVEKQYHEALAQHQEQWHKACRQCGARLTTLIAEDLEKSLAALQELELLLPA